jgi:predicted amidophosphoribosyltransferase
MPKYSKTNTTSQSTLRTIKLKLQGRCDYCSGKLPDHKGVCPVYGKELQERYENIDMEVKHISTLVDNLVREYTNV